MAIPKQRKGGDGAGKRFLLSVSVLGSAGPIRFVVSEGVTAGAVIDQALKAYAKEGRRPILGSDQRDFLLYLANAGSVLKPHETIDSNGSRNFVLCKKTLLHPAVLMAGAAVDEVEEHKECPSRKGSGSIFKSWLSSLKISSH